MTLAWNAPDPAHPKTPTLRLIAHGDSFVLGGGTRKRFAYQAMGLIEAETSDKVELYVEGINGVSFNYTWPEAGYAYTLTQDVTQRVQALMATALPVTVFVQAGSNGIALKSPSNSGAQEYTAFQTYFSALIALGVTASRVVVGTMPPRGPSFEIVRGNFNTALVSGAAGLGHKLARIDSDVDIGQAGQNTDTTYYQADAVHWNDAGAARAARIFKDAMYATVPALSAQTIQFFNRLITMPSASRQAAYSTLIDALVTAGVWAKLDALFLYAAEDRTTALTNLVQEPHRGFLDIGTGVPIFTADRGWSGCGAANSQDVNSNLNPSTAGGNYTQNDAMICAWQIGTVQENSSLINDISADSKIELFPKWSDGHSYWGINGNGTEVSSTAPSNVSGFWLMQRTGASACELHQNDTVIGTSTNGSTALVNQFIISNPVANTVGCLGIGGSVNSTQQTALYNAMRGYMTTVGVP